MAVYFIRSGHDGDVKIGFSGAAPMTRLAQLQTGNPKTLRLLCAVEGNASTERRLHARYAALRTTGEWFQAAEPLLSFIDGVVAASAPRVECGPALDDPLDAMAVLGALSARAALLLGESLCRSMTSLCEPELGKADQLAALLNCHDEVLLAYEDEDGRASRESSYWRGFRSLVCDQLETRYRETIAEVRSRHAHDVAQATVYEAVCDGDDPTDCYDLTSGRYDEPLSEDEERDAPHAPSVIDGDDGFDGWSDLH